MPLNISTGETVFIDANIFYYHFVSLPGLSTACKDSLRRIEHGDYSFDYLGVPREEHWRQGQAQELGHWQAVEVDVSHAFRV